MQVLTGYSTVGCLGTLKENFKNWKSTYHIKKKAEIIISVHYNQKSNCIRIR